MQRMSGPREVVVRRGASGTVKASVGEETLRSESLSDVLEQAQDRLPRSGGRVLMGAGIYDVKSTIVIDRPLRLQGFGAGNTTSLDNMTIIKADEDLVGPVLKVTGSRALNGQMHGSGVFDLGIVGSPGSEQTDCLLLSKENEANLSNMFFERLLIDNADRHGMNFQDVKKHHQIRDIWVGHCEQDGLRLETGYRYWVTNSYFYDSGRHGMSVEGASDVSILSPHCRGNSSAGVYLGADGVQVRGGRFAENTYGMFMDGDGSVIAQAEFINNEEAGVRVGSSRSGAHGNQIVMNRFGIGQPGRLAARLDPGSTEMSGVEKFVDATLNEGVGSAVTRTGRFAFRKAREALESEEEHRDRTGILVSESSRDNELHGNHFLDLPSDIEDDGVRTLIDHTGTNRGNPALEGEWEDRGREGIEVWDRENKELYKYVGGRWRGPLVLRGEG